MDAVDGRLAEIAVRVEKARHKVEDAPSPDPASRRKHEVLRRGIKVLQVLVQWLKSWCHV